MKSRRAQNKKRSRDSLCVNQIRPRQPNPNRLGEPRGLRCLITALLGCNQSRTARWYLAIRACDGRKMTSCATRDGQNAKPQCRRSNFQIQLPQILPRASCLPTPVDSETLKSNQANIRRRFARHSTARRSKATVANNKGAQVGERPEPLAAKTRVSQSAHLV